MVSTEHRMDSRSVLDEDDPDKGFLRGAGPEVLRAIWDKEIEVPEKTIQFVDDNVRASKYPPRQSLCYRIITFQRASRRRGG